MQNIGQFNVAQSCRWRRDIYATRTLAAYVGTCAAEQLTESVKEKTLCCMLDLVTAAIAEYDTPAGVPIAPARWGGRGPQCNGGRQVADLLVGEEEGAAVRGQEICGCRCGKTIEAQPLSDQTCPNEPANGASEPGG